MGSANPGRAEYSDRTAIAQAFQCRDEHAELSVGVPRDVLAEDTQRPALRHHPDKLIDEEPVIGRAEPAPGDAVRLAGIAGSDEMNAAAPRAAVEGSKVRPDRRRMKPPALHRRDQSGSGAGFPLHVSDRAMSGFDKVDADVEPADACAHADAVPGDGDAQGRNSGGIWSHIHATHPASHARARCQRVGGSGGWNISPASTITSNSPLSGSQISPVRRHSARRR